MIKPPFLTHGDKIAITSTARKISIEELQPALSVIRSWGLIPVLSSSIGKSDHQFSGTDEERITGIQELINNPEIKAILCARGGYGTTKIIDQIDFSPLKTHPKWVIGFSDVTAIFCALSKLNIMSIHATMPVFMGKPEYAKTDESLKELIFGNSEYSTPIATHPFNISGSAEGISIGGNLSMLVHLLGTPSEPDWTGKILFLEDIDEYLYHIDRMIVQLERNGVFSKISGLVVGHFTDMKDNTIPFGKTAYKIIHSYATKHKIPTLFGASFGHQPDNFAVIMGKSIKLAVGASNVRISYC